MANRDASSGQPGDKPELDKEVEELNGLIDRQLGPAHSEPAGADDYEDLPILDEVVLPGETLPLDFSPPSESDEPAETSATSVDPALLAQLVNELRGIFDDGLAAISEQARSTIASEVQTQLAAALNGPQQLSLQDTSELTEAAAKTAPEPAEPEDGAPIAKLYDPHSIEQALYQQWEAAGHFQPQGGSRPYCIALPPPNVTGSLHMGHAFQDTLMDTLIRYHRMLGDNTLWQCGTDHAGIATQIVVERQLAEQGLDRQQLGRERFVEQVWKWKQQSGGIITQQLRRMGTSMDWTRERFTLEPALSRAVTEVFVRLYEEGLIYRGTRLVNWDPVLHTAISDLEVVAEEEQGSLWHIRYPFVEDDGHLVVATTRPETMLGDVAVAVNPQDERFQALVGRKVHLPLTGKQIPIIADDYVDKEFGSGCVKITPAHDFNDYEVGERHGLEPINIFTDGAAINSNGPETYQGLDRYEARKRIVADLEAQSLIERIDAHKLVVPRGDRSQTVIEPYLTQQWYVRAQSLAEPAIRAVETGKIKFVPQNWEKTYFEWMRNIQDWCISRQLWWGHRIPAWYDEEGKVYVGRSESQTRERHALSDDLILHQDPDVLDTWFSSGLWPFSTLGWPDETPELKTFYPTNVLVTGFDIIFFWVARMIMLGLKFMDDVPFKEVYIHGLVRDADGQKMSKSKGNILDPIDLIDGIELEALVTKRTSNLMRPQDAEKIERATRKQFPNGIESYGTDALRFTFASLATQGRDIRFDVGRVQGNRNFCNKLWNAARYVLITLEAHDYADNGANVELGLAERWIQALWQQHLSEIIEGFGGYRFDLAAQSFYEFCWDEYCDWYLELSKTVLNDDSASAAAKQGVCRTLVNTLESMLRAAHPLMPFISEEIWRRVAPLAGAEGDSISIQRYPQPDASLLDDDAIQEFGWLKNFVLGVRRIRAEQNIAPGKPLQVLVHGGDDNERRWLQANQDTITRLARISTLNRIKPDMAPDAATALAGNSTLLIPLADFIDPVIESERLEKEIAKHEQAIERSAAKLANPKFVDRAPADVVDRERERHHKLEDALTRLRAQLERMNTLR